VTAKAEERPSQQPPGAPALVSGDIGARDFRAAMARLASAVTLVTTSGAGGQRGMAATAVTSVTDSPPTLVVCVNKSARCNKVIKTNGVFSVNILSGEQADLVQLFSDPAQDDRFGDGRIWSSLKTGSPLLENALANIDCELEQIINIGTHSLFIGQVVALRIANTKRGLVYFDRAFCEVEAT
jgi:flavin reductase